MYTMRITIAIDGVLLAHAQKRAARRSQSLDRYVESAVRRDLLIPEDREPMQDVPIFTRGTGVRPGIDLSSNRAIHDVLDAGGNVG